MSQPDDESNAEVDTASGAPPERRRGTGLLLLTVLVLAAAATVVLVLADNPRWLRLGVVVALWAALVGAFVAVRYRRQVADQHDELDDLAAEHRLELEREAITRREHELRVAEQAQQARQQAQAENDRQLAELRAELRALRQNLEALLGGEVLVERVALRAESTTMRPLSGARMMGMPERLGGFTGVDGHRQLGDRLGYADTAAESRRAESNGKADAGQWFDKRTELVDPVEPARRDPVQPAEPVHPVEPMHPVEPASNTARPAESVAAQQHHPLRGRQPRTRPPSTASMSQPAAPVNQPVAPARPAQPSTPAQPAAWPSRPAHDERSPWSATGSSAQLPPISAEFDLDWTPSWEHREPARHEPTDMTRSHHPDTSATANTSAGSAPSPSTAARFEQDAEPRVGRRRRPDDRPSPRWPATPSSDALAAEPPMARRSRHGHADRLPADLGANAVSDDVGGRRASGHSLAGNESTGSHARQQPEQDAGAHASGKSVSELLAALGGAESGGRRRRRNTP